MAGFYDYIPGSSTTDILYNDEGNGILHQLNWRPNHPISRVLHLQHPLPTPLSSSRGLIICRDLMSSYFICNPFIQNPAVAYRILPNPPRHHPPDSTQVVLAVDILITADHDVAPVFYVICALRSNNHMYSFDVYSSNTGEWHPMVRGIEVWCHIVPDSGVSCGSCAYWLSEGPRCVLKYNVLGDSTAEIVSFIHLPDYLGNHPEATWRFQLGRIGFSLGITIADEALPAVQVSVLQATAVAGQYRWQPVGWLNVVRPAATRWDGSVLHESGTGQLTIGCRELPRAIRFDSSKMEVLLWVDGMVALFESSNENRSMFTNRVSALPYFGVPSCVERGLPLVCTSSSPGQFHVHQP